MSSGRGKRRSIHPPVYTEVKEEYSDTPQSGPKQYFCEVESCRRPFNRRDHLQRHAANHNPTRLFCARCRRGFKRSDLLHRHEKRNVCIERLDDDDDDDDDTAASPTLASSSRSVSMPISMHDEQFPQPTKGRLKRRRRGSDRSLDGQGAIQHNDQSSPPSPPSPPFVPPPRAPQPKRRASTQFRHQPSDAMHRSTLYTPMPSSIRSTIPSPYRSANGHSPSVPASVAMDRSDPYSSTDSGMSGMTGSSGHHAYEPVFYPPPDFAHPHFGHPGHHSHYYPPHLGIDHSNYAHINAAPHVPLEPPAARGDLRYNAVPGWQHLPPPQEEPQAPSRTPNGNGNSQDMGMSSPWDASIHEVHLWDDQFNHADLFDIATPRFQQESAERASSTGATPPLVNRLRTTFPELDFTLPSFDYALDTFWRNVAPSFPFIHRGTFDMHEAPLPLLATMAIVSSVHLPGTDRVAYGKVVQRIRGILVQDCGLEMPISTLQAFCLCHVYDTWYGDLESQFVAQCMWPVMVAHARKKGIGVMGLREHEAKEEEAWSAWAKDEEGRRAAYCVLMIDTQLTTFWNQHPARQLSIFAHNIAFPCPRNQWEARTAAEWFRIRESKKPSPNRLPPPTPAKCGYIPTLQPEFEVKYVREGFSKGVYHAMTVEPKLPLKVDVEHAFGVHMILMGLNAIAWDCRTRGGMGLKFYDQSKDWRKAVMDAVINLRAAWETAVSQAEPCIETRDMRDNFALSIISFQSDIPMLLVAAGAVSVCGATIGPRQLADRQASLRKWAATDNAWVCLWQSARYLRLNVHADWGIYTPWAIYVATLVHWGYTWGKAEKGTIAVTGPTDAPHIQTMAYLDGVLSTSSSLDKLGFGLGDLIVTVADKLDKCEAIEREGAVSLRELIGKTVPLV